MNKNDALNLEDMDVEALEARLETSLLMHPFIYDCGSNTETCNVKVEPALARVN